VLVDRDEAALTALREKHGDAVIPLVIDLLDAKSCATLNWVNITQKWNTQ
jgi:ribitol 2-dehydrogenase